MIRDKQIWQQSKLQFLQNVCSEVRDTAQVPQKGRAVAVGHTKLNAPDPIRTPKLSSFRRGQYQGGGPLGKSTCRQPFFYIQLFCGILSLYLMFYFSFVLPQCFFIVSPTNQYCRKQAEGTKIIKQVERQKIKRVYFNHLFIYTDPVFTFNFKFYFIILLEKNRNLMPSTPRKNPAAFLRKTHQILTKNQICQIISWVEDGNAFAIKDLAKFEAQILPTYFKHSNITSFVRQLNMYGFHKCRHAHFQNTFKHSRFTKDQSNLSEIRRKTEVKKKTKRVKKPRIIFEATQYIAQENSLTQQSDFEIYPIILNKNDIERNSKSCQSSKPEHFNNTSFSFLSHQYAIMFEILKVQNKITSKRQNELKEIVLNYKKQDILLQNQSIQMLEKYNNQILSFQISSPIKSITSNLERLADKIQSQTNFLAEFTYGLNQITKSLIGTNSKIVSTASIEDSAIEIQELQ